MPLKKVSQPNKKSTLPLRQGQRHRESRDHDTPRRVRDAGFIIQAPVRSHTPTLVGIPPELRNQIYRLVLLSDDHVMIDSAGIMEPSISLANKQIRSEAESMFYGENRFAVMVADYDSLPLVKWTEKIRNGDRRGIALPSISIQPSGKPNWRNLRRWAERRYHRSIEVRLKQPPRNQISMSNSIDLTLRILATMFKTIEKMRNNRGSDVAEIVEEFHQVLIEVDHNWA